MTLMVFATVAATVQTIASSTSPEPLILAAGGALGAFVRAFFIKHQATWSKETGFDCVIGLLLGLLWTVPFAGLWPPFAFAPEASYAQRAAIVAIVAMVGVEILKRILIKWAPAFLEDRLEAVLPRRADKPPVEPKTP